MVTEFDSQSGEVRPNQAKESEGTCQPKEKLRKAPADPDFNPPPQTKRAKKGTSNIGKKSKAAKKMDNYR